MMLNYDFANDLRGPDPDRFNWFPIAMIIATVACGVLAWVGL